MSELGILKIQGYILLTFMQFFRDFSLVLPLINMRELVKKNYS